MPVIKLLLLPVAMTLELLALGIAWALARPWPSAALRISMFAERLPDTGWYFRPRKQECREKDPG